MPDRTPPEETGPLRVTRLTGMRCVILRLRAADHVSRQRVGEILGSPLPVTPNRAAGENLWLAPGEWLITGASAPHLSRISAELAGLTFHLADISHGRSVFEISGGAARDLLARGCSLDVHPRVFLPGHCAQTLFAQIPALLHLVSGDFFHLHIDVSHDAYFTAWLKGLSRVFGPFEVP